MSGVPARGHPVPGRQGRLQQWESVQECGASRGGWSMENHRRSWTAWERKPASPCRCFKVMAMAGWVLASIPTGPGPQTFKRAARRGAQGALRSEARASCPSIGSQRVGPPAQQCQPRGAKAPGAAKPAGSLSESQGPGRPAHLLLTASRVPVGGGQYAHPSGRGASHRASWASWQAGKTDQRPHLPAGAR